MGFVDFTPIICVLPLSILNANILFFIDIYKNIFKNNAKLSGSTYNLFFVLIAKYIKHSRL